ncbi:MAG: hypothetical protein Q4D62_09415 [Planctomycetia bacterium]|nr:hypothetical protein [Planctomycetia bacterium]
MELALRQAKKTNPESRVILLGDTTNKTILPVREGVAEFFFLEENEDLKEFRKNYRHVSHLPESFERFCLERWFYLLHFMRQEGLKQSLHLDSDVFLFDDMTKILSCFGNVSMTLGRWFENGYLGHCNRVSQECLETFCRYILEVYRSDKMFQKIQEKSVASDGKIYVSDMSLLYHFFQNTPWKAGFLEDSLQEGIFLDSRISDLDVFRKQPGLLGWRGMIKQVHFENSQPYVILYDGKQIPAKMVHYHGHAKFLMPHHFRGKNEPLRVAVHFYREEIFHRIRSGLSILWKKTCSFFQPPTQEKR